jgi:hypothetical protein
VLSQARAEGSRRPRGSGAAHLSHVLDTPLSQLHRSCECDPCELYGSAVWKRRPLGRENSSYWAYLWLRRNITPVFFILNCAVVKLAVVKFSCEFDASTSYEKILNLE